MQEIEIIFRDICRKEIRVLYDRPPLAFDRSYGLTSSEAEILLQQFGRNELVYKETEIFYYRLVCWIHFDVQRIADKLWLCS